MTVRLPTPCANLLAKVEQAECERDAQRGYGGSVSGCVPALILTIEEGRALVDATEVEVRAAVRYAKERFAAVAYRDESEGVEIWPASRQVADDFLAEAKGVQVGEVGPQPDRSRCVHIIRRPAPAKPGRCTLAPHHTGDCE